jgi:hypothetical protein
MVFPESGATVFPERGATVFPEKHSVFPENGSVFQEGERHRNKGDDWGTVFQGGQDSMHVLKKKKKESTV